MSQIHGEPKRRNSLPDYVKNSIPTTQRRVLLQGLAGYAWYLGERVSIQSLGTLKQRVPTLPPRTMLPNYRLDKQDIKDGLQGWEASTCLIMRTATMHASYRKENLVYRHQPIETFKVRNIMHSLSSYLSICNMC